MQWWPLRAGGREVISAGSTLPGGQQRLGGAGGERGGEDILCRGLSTGKGRGVWRRASSILGGVTAVETGGMARAQTDR